MYSHMYIHVPDVSPIMKLFSSHPPIEKVEEGKGRREQEKRSKRSKQRREEKRMEEKKKEGKGREKNGREIEPKYEEK